MPKELRMVNGDVVDADGDTERCEECGREAVAVPLADDRDGWRCPICDHYNDFGGA